MYKSSAACVCRRPLAVVVERVGETRSRVVEVAAELHGAIVVLGVVVVVVGVGAFQLGEIEARRRTILFREFVPVAVLFPLVSPEAQVSGGRFIAAVAARL